MKFSVNWLHEFVDLPENPEEIADLLTRAGVETENIETRGAKTEQVIVSKIVASSRRRRFGVSFRCRRPLRKLSADQHSDGATTR